MEMKLRKEKDRVYFPRHTFPWNAHKAEAYFKNSNTESSGKKIPCQLHTCPSHGSTCAGRWGIEKWIKFADDQMCNPHKWNKVTERRPNSAFEDSNHLLH